MNEDLAKQRFFLIALMRVSGLAIALIGIGILAKRWIEPAEVVGVIFVVIGIFDLGVVPLILARRWRTPSDG